MRRVDVDVGDCYVWVRSWTLEVAQQRANKRTDLGTWEKIYTNR